MTLEGESRSFREGGGGELVGRVVRFVEGHVCSESAVFGEGTDQALHATLCLHPANVIVFRLKSLGAVQVVHCWRFHGNIQKSWWAAAAKGEEPPLPRPHTFGGAERYLFGGCGGKGSSNAVVTSNNRIRTRTDGIIGVSQLQLQSGIEWAGFNTIVHQIEGLYTQC